MAIENKNTDGRKIPEGQPVPQKKNTSAANRISFGDLPFDTEPAAEQKNREEDLFHFVLPTEEAPVQKAAAEKETVREKETEPEKPEVSEIPEEAEVPADAVSPISDFAEEAEGNCGQI